MENILIAVLGIAMMLVGVWSNAYVPTVTSRDNERLVDVATIAVIILGVVVVVYATFGMKA